MRSSVILAVEDILSDALSRRVLEHCGVAVAQAIGYSGSGYLKKKAASLNKTALGYPVFMLTDLDSPKHCPVELMRAWIGSPRNPSFLFRVAVMEVEAWMLADRDAFAQFAGVGVASIPDNPDTIPDPKQYLVNLVRKSKNKSLRQDVVPADGATTPIGPAYNQRLTSFIETSWSVTTAIVSSPSLRRTVAAVQRFAGSGSNLHSESDRTPSRKRGRRP